MKNCLIWIIQFYRKYLSHTLYKHRKCFFKDTCSTHILRIFKNENLMTAIKLLYWRLIKGRCDCYALYEIHGYLCWAEGYDQLPENLNTWINEMRENKKEQYSTIERILSNFYHILRYQHKSEQAEEVKKILNQHNLSINCYLLKLPNPFQKHISRRIALFSFSLAIIICALMIKLYILGVLGVILFFYVRKTIRRENALYTRFLTCAKI